MTFIKSKVFRLLAPQQLVISEEELDIDNLPENHFYAETEFSAISPGTEAAAFEGKEPLRPGKIYPRLVGYCNVAKVAKVGYKVCDLSVGDYVLTFQSHRSSFIQDCSGFYLKIDKDIAKDATVSYLFHLGYHSILTAKAMQGHYLAVLGAGVLGVSTAIMSQIAGIKTVVFTNQQSARLFFDENQPNIKSFCKEESSFESIKSLTSGSGLDFIINTSNSWNDWRFALKAISPNGIIVNLGFPGRGEPLPNFNPLDPQYVYTKNLTIKALCPLFESDIEPSHVRFNLKRNLLNILDLLKNEKIFSSQLVSDEISYLNLKEQYIKYISKKHFMLSTIISWKN